MDSSRKVIIGNTVNSWISWLAIAMAIAMCIFYSRYPSKIHEVGGHDTIEWVSTDLNNIAPNDWRDLTRRFPFRVVLKASLLIGNSSGASPMQSAAFLNLLLTATAILGVFAAVRTMTRSAGAGLAAAALFGSFASTQYFATESDCYVFLSALAALTLWQSSAFVQSRRTSHGFATVALLCVGCWTHQLFFFLLIAVAFGWLESKRLSRQTVLKFIGPLVIILIIGMMLSWRQILFDHQQYKLLGYGTSFHFQEGILLTLASMVATVDLIHEGVFHSIKSWQILGKSLVILTLCLCFFGAVISLTQRSKRSSSRLILMVLFFGWWIFLIHWSTEYHFFSILMVPMAIIAGLGADGLLRFSTRIFVPVLTALILLLMFYNADLVTIRKSDPNNSPIRPLYEIAKRSDVDNVLFITRDYLAPHRIAFLFRENINVNAAACAYTIGSKNEIIFQEPSEYNHCSLIGNEGLLVVQSIDVNMAMILTALIDPNVASKPIGYLKLSKFNSIMIFFFKY